MTMPIVAYLAGCVANSDRFNHSKKPETSEPLETSLPTTSTTETSNETSDTETQSDTVTTPDTSDVAQMPVQVDFFEIDGRAFATAVDAKNLYLINKFEGNYQNPPRFELQKCNLENYQCEQIGYDIGSLLDLNASQFNVSQVLPFNFEGQQLLALPYNSFSGFIPQDGSDNQQSQPTSDLQGVFIYDAKTGVMVGDIALEDYRLGYRAVSGPESVAFNPDTNQLAVTLSMFASGAQADDSDIVTNEYGTPLPGGAIALINIANHPDHQNEIQVEDIQVLPLIDDKGNTYYNPGPVIFKDGRYLVSARLGRDGNSASLISIDPSATDLTQKDALKVVAENLPVDSGYNLSVKGEDIILTGDRSEQTISILNQEGQRTDYFLNAALSYVAGSLGFHQNNTNQNHYGTFVTGQNENHGEFESQFAGLWCFEGNCQPVDLSDIGQFIMPPLMGGDEIVVLTSGGVASSPKTTVTFFK